MSIVVVGGGIVGVTAAHYLTKQGHRVTLVEKCGVACHSSGKAGGFLTDGDSGWHRGPIAKLAKHSFALHQQLAQELGHASIGYRNVRCVTHGPGGIQKPPGWLCKDFNQDMGEQSKMAQVSPHKFMASLEQAIRRQGCEVLVGKVVGVNVEGNKVTAVKVQKDGQEDSLPCSSVIFCMGVWAREVAAWFPESSLPKDTVSNRYTSVIWDDTEIGKDATMVFVSQRHQVEIYPRSDECYSNGCPSDADLPDDPQEIVPPPQTIEDVKAEAISAVGRLKDAKVLRATACFLAGSDDGLPVVGLVPKMANAVIACGGGCWGILNGPAMGQASAALAVQETPVVDISSFDPIRFDRSRRGQHSGLPPKLEALLAQHPELLEMMQTNPTVAESVLQSAMQGEDG